MKMHALSGGRLRMKARAFNAAASSDETIDLPCCCFLLRHSQGNVLFDTGCHPSVATNAEARWGSVTRSVKPVMAPDDNVITALSSIGLVPDDIDLVVNSHLHMDHCGCNSFFRQATNIVHERELAAARESEGKGYFSADWDCGMQTQTIEDEVDLFNDGKIILIPVPGHSAGTMGALVTLDRDGMIFLAADSVSVESNLRAETIPVNTWNADLFARSIATVRNLETRGARIFYGHDAEQWKGLRKGLHAYQ